MTRTSATARRMTIPLLLMIIKSFSSVTFLIETRRPVLSVMFKVLTPLPICLTMVFSLQAFLTLFTYYHPCLIRWDHSPRPTDNCIIASIKMHTTDTRSCTTHSSYGVLIKRTARPFRFAKMSSLWPFVKRTSITSSPSTMLIAMTPFARGRE